MPGHLVTNRDSLIIVDAALGDVVVWPLLVPTEVTVDVVPSEGMSALYNYLYDQGLLTTKTVSLENSIEHTLRKYRILLSPYVPSLNPVICGLNSSLCANGAPKKVLAAGIPLAVPDLYSESVIDSLQVTLRSGRTLEAEARSRVSTNVLRDWTSEAKLRQLNPQFKVSESDTIGNQKEGTFTVPVEIVRYIAALPESYLLRSQSRLSLLRNQFYPTLTIAPLAERVASVQQANLDGMVARPDPEVFRRAYTDLLKTVNYARPDMPQTSASVGVAEKEIDCGTADFGGDLCDPPDELQSTPQSISPPNAPQITYRSFDLLDHGTAVASLIGARHSAFSSKGLAAPEVSLYQISTTDPPLGDNVRRAHLNGCRIFNLSLSFDEGDLPIGLARYMDLHNQRTAYKDTLFVVSAPDDGKPVCGGINRFPVCWANQPNVIAVALR